MLGSLAMNSRTASASGRAFSGSPDQRGARCAPARSSTYSSFLFYFYGYRCSFADRPGEASA